MRYFDKAQRHKAFGEAQHHEAFAQGTQHHKVLSEAQSDMRTIHHESLDYRLQEQNIIRF